jgi:hypothetical protein
LGERLGSGDGEREASMTRQIAFEPLPASVLFAFVGTQQVDDVALVSVFTFGTVSEVRELGV